MSSQEDWKTRALRAEMDLREFTENVVRIARSHAVELKHTSHVDGVGFGDSRGEMAAEEIAVKLQQYVQAREAQEAVRRAKRDAFEAQRATFMKSAEYLFANMDLEVYLEGYDTPGGEALKDYVAFKSALRAVLGKTS